MRRSLIAAFVACSAVLHALHLSAAIQADAFRISTRPLADVHQETLQAVDPASKQTVEVFPGAYVSPYGEGVMKRIVALLERVDQADREALVAKKVGAGFDRAITSWRAHPSGRTVALAVHYYRDSLLNLELEMSDDYGRTEPFIPARHEFITIAVCSQAGAGAWTCREEQLAEVAGRNKMTLPQDRAGRMAVAEKLVALAAAGQ